MCEWGVMSGRWLLYEVRTKRIRRRKRRQSRWLGGKVVLSFLATSAISEGVCHFGLAHSPSKSSRADRVACPAP